MSIDRRPERVSQIAIGAEYIDENGHVEDSDYLKYFREERGAYLEERGFTLNGIRELHGLYFVVADYQKFRHPGEAKMGDVVQVHSQLEGIGRFIVFDHQMRSEDDTSVICEARPRLVTKRVGSNGMVTLPQFLTVALEAYIPSPDV